MVLSVYFYAILADTLIWASVCLAVYPNPLSVVSGVAV